MIISESTALRRLEPELSESICKGSSEKNIRSDISFIFEHHIR